MTRPKRHAAPVFARPSELAFLVCLAAVPGCYLSHELGDGMDGDAGEMDAAVCEGELVPVAGLPFSRQAGPIERVPLYAGENFGAALAWSGDGTRLAVGAFQDWVDGAGRRTAPEGREARLAGSVTILDATTPCFSLRAYLLPSGDHDDHLGLDVAISRDGRTVVASAFRNFLAGSVSTATPNVVYVFRDSGHGLVETQRISTDDSASTFGASLALADGALFVGDSASGSVSAFVDDGGVFVPAGTYTSAAIEFGAAVAATQDGSLVVVGAPDSLGGEVDLFSFSPAAGLTLLDQITAADARARAGLGVRVAVSTHGEVVAATSVERVPRAGASPLVTIIRRVPGSARRIETLGTGDGPLLWGRSLAVTEDGNRVAWASAELADGSDAALSIAELRGDAFVLVTSGFVPRPGGLPSPCTASSRPHGVAFASDGRLALGADALCGADSDGTTGYAGRVFVYE